MLAAVATLVGGTGVATGPAAAGFPHRTSTTVFGALTSEPSWTYRSLKSPARVQVLDGSRAPVATFTVGARTATIRGAARVFGEPATTTATVTSTTWVRLLPQPFTGTVDRAWLDKARSDTSPDLLAKAAQYVSGAPRTLAADGTRLAGDADYGPLRSDGTRAEGADFNDYLAVGWTYGSSVDTPETDQVNALDCSGFIRMVTGYRAGLPMSLSPDGVRLPRRAVQMLSSAPGVVTVPDTGTRPISTAPLSPGDLVFFDGSTDDGALVDHVGMYLGPDSGGAHRFISSRKTVNGPTLGDVGGRSVLSGTGHYASTWRAARRL
jgi:cell wall-associated NlpC family hydrolase